MSRSHPLHPLVPLRRRGNCAPAEEALSVYGRAGSVSQREPEGVCSGEGESAMPGGICSVCGLAGAAGGGGLRRRELVRAASTC